MENFVYQETKAICKSIYMLVVFHKPNSSNPNGETNMEVCGCQGCSVGDECCLIKGYKKIDNLTKYEF